MSWSPDNNIDGSPETGHRRKRRSRDSQHAPATFSTVFDVTFVKSVAGILLVLQVICCFLGLVLASSWRGSYTGGHIFFIIAVVVTFISSLFLFVCRAIKLDDLLLRNVEWPIVFAYYSGPAALLMLVAGCVMVEAAKAVSALKAAGVFGLFAWNALLCSFLLHGKPLLERWRPTLPTQTATMTPAPAVQTNPDSDMSSDDWSDDDQPPNDDSSCPVVLKHTTLEPPSAVPVSAAPSSLYPVDIAGSNRASTQRDSAQSATSGSWVPD